MTLDRHARARVALLRGRSYSVWARREQAGGSSTLSDLHESVRDGMSVVLEPEAHVRPRVELLVNGTEPWREHGPLRCFVRTPGVGAAAAEFDLPADGRVTIPALPCVSALVVLRDARGLQLAEFERTQHARAPDTFCIEPPRTFAVLATNGRNASPIAGATVHRRSSGSELAIARCGEDGRASLTLPQPPFARREVFPPSDVLFVQAPGFGPAPLELRGDGTLVSALHPSRLLGGRITITGERPAPDVRVVLIESFLRAEHPLDGVVPPPPRTCVARTDRDGRFAFEVDARVNHLRTRVAHLVLPAKLMNDGTDPLVVAPFDPNDLDESEPLALAELLHVDLRVLESDGAPACFAWIHHEGRTLRADRDGRIRFLARDEPTAMWITSDRGSRLVDVDRTSASAPRIVTLRPNHELSGHITSSNGTPRAGVRYRVQPLRPREPSPAGLGHSVEFTTTADGGFTVHVADVAVRWSLRRAANDAPVHDLVVPRDAKRLLDLVDDAKSP